jgi:CheY-like chemotaxis protein
MDIMMPGMDGFETIRRIRTDLNRPELPIITVTAKAFPEDRERCIQAGASDYLAKPIDEKQLIVLIGSSLGN